MDRATVDIYDRRGLEWAASHTKAGRRAEAEAFDAGWSPVGSASTWAAAPGDTCLIWDHRRWASTPRWPCWTPVALPSPDAHYVQGDVEHLPFARHSLDGAWSWMTHLHVPRDRLPMALWDLHRVLRVGSPFEVQVLEGAYEGDDLPGDQLAGRYFAGWEPGPPGWTW